MLIIIPTFQGKQHLAQSLAYLGTLVKQPHQVMVVNNGSTDGTSQWLQETYPEVKCIQLDRNYGFTKAVNVGVKAASSEFVLILNNDCLINPEDIEKLETFAKDYELVATQPMIVKPVGNTVEGIGYVVDLKKGKARVIREANEIPNQVGNDNDDMWRDGSVYGLSATCLLVRRDIFLQEGGFDESFHSYLEDVDLFIRFAMKGYRYAPCLDVTAIHEHMATSKRMGVYKEMHDLTNWVRIILKHYPKPFLLRHFPTLLLERMRNGSGVVKKSINNKQ